MSATRTHSHLHAAAALKLARKKQAGGDDAGAMKMAQKSLRILE